MAKKMTQDTFKVSRFGFIDLGLPSGACWCLGVMPGTYTFKEAIDIFGKYLPTEKDFEELCKYCKFEDFKGFPVGQGPILKEDGTPVLNGNGSIKMIPCVIDFPGINEDCVRAMSLNNGGMIFFKDDLFDGIDYWMRPSVEDAENIFGFRGPESFSPIDPHMGFCGYDRTKLCVKLVFHP